MKDFMAELKEQEKKIEAAWAESNKLPKGVVPGKLFRLPHADGYAVYQVVKVGKRTATVKWRKDLTIDEWQDNILGPGGSFSLNVIARSILWEESMAEIFGQNSKK